MKAAPAAHLVISLILCGATSLVAQTATPTPAPDLLAPPPAALAVPLQLGASAEVSDAIMNFFKTLQHGEVDRAYDSLTKDSKFASGPNELDTLKKKTQEAIRLYGAIRNAEATESKRVGANLVRVTMLSLGRDLPLRWRFYFYNSAEGWKLIDLRVDDRLVDLFGENASDSSAP